MTPSFSRLHGVVTASFVMLLGLGCGDATTGPLPSFVDLPDTGVAPSTNGGGTSGTGNTGNTGSTSSTSSTGGTGVTTGAVSCSATSDAGATNVVPVGPPMTGLHVTGNQIMNAAGQAVALHGVNRSGTEYSCSQGRGIFDGPSDAASVATMASWKVNAVRVPLNESCWLAINGVAACYAGDFYKNAIRQYVALLHQFNIVPILDLHWVGPGTSKADRLQPLPDKDHAAAFWSDVATTFKDDDGVIFELFNEPFPDRNQDSETAWTCWRDGCTANQSLPRNPDGGVPPSVTYEAAGMQRLVDAVRDSGANQIVLLGGVQYSNSLSGWLSHKPNDKTGNLGATWHVYNFNACSKASCWDTAPAAVAAAVPLVATEIGENHCDDASYIDGYFNPLLAWLDAHSSSYLAWAWVAYGACTPPSGTQTQGGQPWSLITDYASGTPNSLYARTYHDHLAAF